MPSMRLAAVIALPLLVSCGNPSLKLSGSELSCVRADIESGFWLDQGKLYSGYPDPQEEVLSTDDIVQEYRIQNGGNKVEFKSYWRGSEGIGDNDHWLIDFDNKRIEVLTANDYHQIGKNWKCDSDA